MVITINDSDIEKAVSHNKNDRQALSTGNLLIKVFQDDNEESKADLKRTLFIGGLMDYLESYGIDIDQVEVS